MATPQIPTPFFIESDTPTVIRSRAIGRGYYSGFATVSQRYAHPSHGGEITQAEAQVIAAFIVKACNAHAKLIKAVEDLIKHEGERVVSGIGTEHNSPALECAQDAACALLIELRKDGA